MSCRIRLLRSARVLVPQHPFIIPGQTSGISERITPAIFSSRPTGTSIKWTSDLNEILPKRTVDLNSQRWQDSRATHSEVKSMRERRGVRISAEVLNDRLKEHLENSPETSEALQKLAGANCEMEIVVALAKKHCLTKPDGATSKLKTCLSRMEKSFDSVAGEAEKTMNSLQELGLSAKLATKLELDTLIPLLKTRARMYGHLKGGKLGPAPNDTRIHLPLLCIYVQEVTGKEHFAELAAVLRMFYAAAGIRDKEYLTADAVGKAFRRHKTKQASRHQQLCAATKSFLANRDLAGENPLQLLFGLAFMETGLLSTRKSGQNEN